VTDYRSIIRAHQEPAFGPVRIEDLTGDAIEAWKATSPVGNRTKAKILKVLNGVLKRARRVHKLGYNAMADVEKPRFRSTTAIEVSRVRRSGRWCALPSPSRTLGRLVRVRSVA
jgi:hypothetical protein